MKDNQRKQKIIEKNLYKLVSLFFASFEQFCW